MFAKILHANDGSEPAFHAFGFALDLAKQNRSDLHMVCVEELPYIPDFIEEVEQMTETAARRFERVLERARSLAQQSGLTLTTHVFAGHPVRDIVKLAGDLDADIVVIGARGHSELYQRTIGSRADRIVQLAPCPVLVVK
jgi:nucleotide-binding universal stress UspA family protein